MIVAPAATATAPVASIAWMVSGLTPPVTMKGMCESGDITFFT